MALNACIVCEWVSEWLILKRHFVYAAEALVVSSYSHRLLGAVLHTNVPVRNQKWDGKTVEIEIWNLLPPDALWQTSRSQFVVTKNEILRNFFWFGDATTAAAAAAVISFRQKWRAMKSVVADNNAHQVTTAHCTHIWTSFGHIVNNGQPHN